MPPGSAAGERERGGEELEEDERQQDLPDELAVHGLIDDVVAGTHDLGEAEEADGSDHEAGDGGLEEKGPAGQRAQARTKIAEDEGETAEQADRRRRRGPHRPSARADRAG